MKRHLITLAVAFFFVFLGGQFASAVSEKASMSKAIQEMAEIMIHLNHHPSDSEKGSLKNIIKNDSTTDWERVLAKAVLNLKHKATASDKKKLNGIMEDQSAPTAVRDLAGIIYNLNHKPTGGDKEKLGKMMK